MVSAGHSQEFNLRETLVSTRFPGVRRLENAVAPKPGPKKEPPETGGFES